MTPDLNREFLDDVTRQTWSLFLGVTLTPIQTRGHDVDCAALIAIQGAWNGVLVVSCSQRLARLAAARLYSLPEQDIDETRWQDTLNETANIIGGNLKALLPAPSRLGLPTPITGGTPVAACAVAYHSDYGELCVTLLDAEEAERVCVLPPFPSRAAEAGRTT